MRLRKTFIPSPEELLTRLGVCNLVLVLADGGSEFLDFEKFDGNFLITKVTSNKDLAGTIQFIGTNKKGIPYAEREKRNTITQLAVMLSPEGDVGVSLLLTTLYACDPSLSGGDMSDILSILLDKGEYSYNGLDYKLDMSIIPLLTISISK